MDVPNLTRDDARVRADLLDIDSYDVTLDVTAPDGSPSARTFRSRSEIRFRARQAGASTFVDLLAETYRRQTATFGIAVTEVADAAEDDIWETVTAGGTRLRHLRERLAAARRGAGDVDS